MIPAHMIIRHWRTNDPHWKRTMASHSRKLAQNHVAAPLRWEEIESDYGPRLLLIARFPDYFHHYLSFPVLQDPGVVVSREFEREHPLIDLISGS